MSRRGFSLAEALIAMAIGSLLLMGACRFLPALQRHILRQGEQLALENELWQRVHAVGKHLQRAGYCRGACGGAGLELAAGGECLIANIPAMRWIFTEAPSGYGGILWRFFQQTVLILLSVWNFSEYGTPLDFQYGGCGDP